MKILRKERNELMIDTDVFVELDNQEIQFTVMAEYQQISQTEHRLSWIEANAQEVLPPGFDQREYEEKVKEDAATWVPQIILITEKANGN